MHASENYFTLLGTCMYLVGRYTVRLQLSTHQLGTKLEPKQECGRDLALFSFLPYCKTRSKSELVNCQLIKVR